MSTEIEIMKRIRHRHIVSMYELYETPKCLWIILELVNRCVLRGMEYRGSRCDIDIKLNIPSRPLNLNHACRSLYGELFGLAKSAPHNYRHAFALFIRQPHAMCYATKSIQ